MKKKIVDRKREKRGRKMDMPMTSMIRYWMVRKHGVGRRV